MGHVVLPIRGIHSWYPFEGADGNMYSGFDDGGVGTTSVASDAPTFTTGSAIVEGDDWRHLGVRAVGGAVHESGYPMIGRYSSMCEVT